ncbi:cupin domain-containing protein [Pantoea sp. A4]|uniref:cupin domain-containing protein n=1 Tax=Pantoea sp. A4 TaxID=1225184 RepID=UPI000380E88C|nr:cupin domain-containing protein [Pantoea sp. A4]
MTELSRRHFMSWISGLALAAPTLFSRYAAAAPHADNVQLLHLERNSWVPNNAHLPVILYKQALAPAADRTGVAEAQFEHHQWPPQWVASIFDYHHYHSTAHEVLGCVSGKADVMLGGPGGHVVTLSAGDVVLLPTGTGHCNQGSSDDFLVVGAYPPQQNWDICREAPTQAMIDRMAHLPFPASDPVTGAQGPLISQWQRS